MHIPTQKREVLKKYRYYISKSRVGNLSAYGLDIALTGKKGVMLSDTGGNTYYDCFCSGGQQVLGNYRPEVRDALRDALKKYDLGNFIIMSAQKAALAKLLAEITPGSLKNTVYGVGRGEANDFAMKLARGATGRKEIICFEGAAHGQTGFALAVGDNPRQEKLFGPLIPGIRRIPPTIAAVQNAVSGKTAAVIAEPLQSDSGIKPLSPALLKTIRTACNSKGAIFIFDEGQTAFGRTGLLFECMRYGITPDILNMAKGMGGTYYPITATVFKSRLNRFLLTHPLIHLSTFGGSDIGCLVALATIEIIRKNRLWENAAKRGDQLKKGLQQIASDKAGKFSDVRGEGLLLGIEAKDAVTAEKFTAALAGEGVIALTTPLNPLVVRFTPPIDITHAETEAILESSAAAAEKI